MMSASLSYARRKGVTERFRKYSNGENAFLYFTNTIGETGLYLLDEPKNSLSPALQLHLAKFLKTSMKLRPQFIIATHKWTYDSGEAELTGVDASSAPVIPEPATATLSLPALAGLAARRRRK